jgi:hypothetical protein
VRRALKEARSKRTAEAEHVYTTQWETSVSSVEWYLMK